MASVMSINFQSKRPPMKFRVTFQVRDPATQRVANDDPASEDRAVCASQPPHHPQHSEREGQQTALKSSIWRQKVSF